MHAPVVVALVALLLPLLAAAPDATCAQATCGNLSIRYPFWLRGQQPSYCGYPSFGVACDDDATGGALPVLSGSYLRVLGIHYGNSSVVAFHASLADDGPASWLVYLSRRSYGTGGGPVRDTTSSSAGCRYSAVPVLPWSPELRALGDYARLVRQGFLMEWTVPGDCTACNASGGSAGMMAAAWMH